MEREKELRRRSATGEHMGKKSKSSPKKIKLSVGDTVILADKQRLIEISPYFASLLRFHADDDLEAVSLIPLENVDLNCFVAMLHSLTSTSLMLIITEANLWDYLVLSKYFQAEHIEEDCWNAFRKFLPTLAMDELLRLWRNGHACAVDKATTLALAGISFRMENASESPEFLDLPVDELVALLSDDGFLPLTEEAVCKAVKAWCEHDPESRKTTDVLDRVLAEIVWDESTKPLIQSILPQCQQPDKMPKRSVNSDDHKIPDDGLLRSVEANAGIIVGNVLYYLWNGDVGHEDYDSDSKPFYRMDMNNQPYEEELDPIDMENLKLDPDDGSEVECGLTMALCLVRLPGGDKIGCFASNLQCIRFMDDYVNNVAIIIALYDFATNKWQNLLGLPLPRTGCAMIECGSFLYVIGSCEHKALDRDGDNAQHCVRLNLIDGGGQWERIADLSAPRTDHTARVQYGRIIVHGGQARTKIVAERYNTLEFEDARWSEAYDPTLNCWTVLK